MTLIPTLLAVLKGQWSSMGLRAECGEKVTATVLIRNREISLTGFAGVGLKDVENVLHELTAIMLKEKRASIGLARYPHYVTCAAPQLEPKLLRAAWACVKDKKSFFTTGIKLILPESFSVTLAADEDAIHCVFGSSKPMVDGPLSFDYLVDQVWIRESGIDIELSDRSRHRKTWSELGMVKSPTQAELSEMAKRNPPAPEWHEGEMERPF